MNQPTLPGSFLSFIRRFLSIVNNPSNTATLPKVDPTKLPSAPTIEIVPDTTTKPMAHLFKK